jgi:hypothetical protein
MYVLHVQRVPASRRSRWTALMELVYFFFLLLLFSLLEKRYIYLENISANLETFNKNTRYSSKGGDEECYFAHNHPPLPSPMKFCVNLSHASSLNEHLMVLITSF